MGREVRRVPVGWKHPTYGDLADKGCSCHNRWKWRDEPHPLYDRDYDERAQQWLDDLAAWERDEGGQRTEAMEKYGTRYFWDWDGMPPDKHFYRPKWAEAPIAYQIYETVSEGTPVSPVFETLGQMREWLISQGTSPAAADGFVRMGWVPSMTAHVRPDGSGTITEGFEQAAEY